MVEKATRVEIPVAPKNPPSPVADLQATINELTDDLIAGRKSLIDVRRYLMSIKHPGERLKAQYEFRQQIRRKLGLSPGIDKWGDYVNSLKRLQSRFIPQ